MDRKSFFKNILLAFGAAIIPNSILRSITLNKVEAEGPKLLGSYTPVGGEDTTLYWQLQNNFGSDAKMVKANKFYWAEYECGPYEEKLKVITENRENI